MDFYAERAIILSINFTPTCILFFSLETFFVLLDLSSAFDTVNRKRQTDALLRGKWGKLGS